MQQRPLGFAPITADDAQQQRLRIAQQFAAELAARPAPQQPQQRAVGRPKRPLSVADALAAPLVAAPAAVEPASKRGKYTSWFASPFLPDILAAYPRHGHSARRTVTALQRAHPDGRFARLSHSTVGCWYGKDHQLLPQFQKQLEEHRTAARGRGPTRAFDEAPEGEREIKRVLLQMRAAGAPLNCNVIRWVMRAIMEEQCPELLACLKLTHQFISSWARSQLDWRWRARTTAASKLPADWEDQGVVMAKRIAATMEMHKVSLLQRASIAVVRLPLMRISLLCVPAGASLSGSQHGSDGCPSCAFIFMDVREGEQL